MSSVSRTANCETFSASRVDDVTCCCVLCAGAGAAARRHVLHDDAEQRHRAAHGRNDALRRYVPRASNVNPCGAPFARSVTQTTKFAFERK